VWQLISTFAGGIGLFLLGMWLMTEGLRLGAGGALRQVLERWTHSPARGLASGIGLTAIVQSSSAVTVATVGFVNAGLLTLAEAVWVIYGANVGTTMTGWIVAATGVEVKLDVYALPLVALGMFMRLRGAGTRTAAYGQALAGFALFLLGIQTLKANFSELAQVVDFAALPSSGPVAGMLYLGIGIVITLLVQSSSATVVITLSAASAGVIPPPLVALVIIGANLGTSSTAAIAAVGATAEARRVAASHVLFNLVTTVFAVASLPWLLPMVVAAQAVLGLPEGAPVTLALFATTFNVIGVVLMLPLTRPMVRFLQRRFTTDADNLARTQHLDATLLGVPDLALQALLRELQRLGGHALHAAAEAAGPAGPDAAARRTGAALRTLAAGIRRHAAQVNRTAMSEEAAAALAPLLRALQHYEEVLDLALRRSGAEVEPTAEYARAREAYAAAVRAVFAACDTAREGFAAPAMEAAATEAARIYVELKERLLRGAALGELPMVEMDAHMREIGDLQDAVERAVKAAQRVTAVRQPPR
jgi:phosphate:Na+ symporter